MKRSVPICLLALLVTASACAPIAVTVPTNVQSGPVVDGNSPVTSSNGIKAALSSAVLASGEKRDLVSLLRTPEGQVWTQPLVWTSSDDRVVMVEAGTGRVSGVGQGTAIVTASLQGDPNVKVGIEVSVVEKPAVVLIKVEPGMPTVAIGEKLKLVPSVQMADGQINGNVSWGSSDDTIATVNPTTGEVSALKEGRVTIVASYTVDSRYKGLAEVSIVKDRALVPPSPSPSPVVFQPGASALPTTLPSPIPTPSAASSSPTPTPSPTQAVATTGTIVGIVKNAETLEGEPGVKVSLSSGASATTGADGTYSISAPAGTATLTATKTRFDTANNKLTVAVTAGSTTSATPLSLIPLHWVNQVSGVNQDLYGVHAVDEQRAWAVGRAGTILRTTDGGASWLPAQSAPAVDYKAVFFANANTGWAVGGSGTILKSLDGGSSWSSQVSGTSQSIQDVLFVNDSTGWAVTNYEVLSTKDGGTTWTKNTQASGWRLAALNANHVVVGGSYVYISTTGGQTWQQGSYQINMPDFVSIFSATEIWWNYYSSIYRSDDGGITASQVENSYATGFRDPGGRILASKSCNRLFFITPRVGWAVSSSGKIEKY